MDVNIEPAPVAQIEHLEALATLVDSQRHRIVTMLMDEALTAKEIAERLKIGRTRLYYHLGMLEQHGIIRVTDTRLVSGIAERTYRAVARSFRVNRKLLSSEASELQITYAQASILEAVAHDFRVRELPGEPQSDEDLLVARIFLRLNHARRKELRDRLSALVNEYSEPDPDGSETEVALALFTSTAEAS